MVEITSGSVTTIKEQIANHLEYNITIPLPHAYIEGFVPVCIQAIKAVNNHNLDELIELPKGATCIWQDGTRSNLCPAYAIVHRYELDQWLNKEWF